MDVTGITGSSASGAASTAGARLVGDFDTFLLLLTAQLQNQDPLSPMDTTEFTNQLVAFAGVEQQITQNTHLESLIDLQKVSRAAQALSFLGTRIEAPGDTTALADGSAEWNYELTENMRSVVIKMIDDSGDTVFETDATSDAGVSTNAGVHQFVWNGKNAFGESLPDGNYRISIDAKNPENEPVPVGTTVVGSVTGIQTVEDSMVLFIGSISVPLEDVLSVQAGDIADEVAPEADTDPPSA